MYKYVLYNTIETPKEKLFNQKCYGFLSVIQIESLLNTPYLLDKIFESDVLTTSDINRILLKKYCITKHEKNIETTTIDSYLNSGKIEHVDQLITHNNHFKLEVFKTYIKNITDSNHDLAIEKAHIIGYEKVAKRLAKIDEFYNYEDLRIAKEATLKKSKTF